jgi:5-methylthioadenosine/S-adenosylhomocysteine deaminase
VTVGVSPHAVYSVHEDLLVDACAWAVGQGLPVAIHVAESREEMEFLREARGPFAESHRERGLDVVRRAHSPVHLLVELGVTTVARPLLVHCVQLDASDVHFIARDGCPVAHCPASNAKLGHGVAPLADLLDAGVVVGIGTDSVASTDRMDLLDEARLAVLAQRARLRRPDALSAESALELATLGGARALGLADRVGALEPGRDADLAAFRLDEPRGVSAGEVASTLVFSLAGRAAWMTAVAGRELVRDGRLVHDDPALPARVAAVADALRTPADDHARAGA